MKDIVNIKNPGHAARVTNGHSYKGTIYASYNDLVEIFGNPYYTDPVDSKSTSSWAIRYTDSDSENRYFSIYDWKARSYDDVLHRLGNFNVGGDVVIPELQDYINEKKKEMEIPTHLKAILNTRPELVLQQMSPNPGDSEDPTFRLFLTTRIDIFSVNVTVDVKVGDTFSPILCLSINQLMQNYDVKLVSVLNSLTDKYISWDGQTKVWS